MTPTIILNDSSCSGLRKMGVEKKSIPHDSKNQASPVMEHWISLVEWKGI